MNQTKLHTMPIWCFFRADCIHTKKKNWSKTVVKRKNRKKIKAVIRKKFIKSFNCRLLKLATNNYNRTKPATESNSAEFVSTWDYPSDNPYPPSLPTTRYTDWWQTDGQMEWANTLTIPKTAQSVWRLEVSDSSSVRLTPILAPFTI